MQTQQLESLKPSWTPRPYMVDGVKLLIQQAAAGLLLDPGLGKTSIALMAMTILLFKKYAKKILIVAPLQPCFSTWPAEIGKWAEFQGLSWTILHADHEKGKEENLKKDVDIYIINPAGLKWLLSQTSRPRFDILCVDESTDFKDTQTQRFKLMKQLLPECAYRWILTGTVIPNGLEDLFGQIYILDEGASLGRYITQYRMAYFNVDYSGYRYTPRVGAFEQIVEKIRPLVLRLSAKHHLGMPELLQITRPVRLPPSIMKQYKAVENEFFLELDRAVVVAANSAIAGGKCRQIANGAVYVHEEFEAAADEADHLPTVHGLQPKRPKYEILHDEKLDNLERLVNELSGAPLLVAYEYQHDRERILARFPKAEVISTGVSHAKRQASINAFNEGKLQLLLGHPASMSLGLNLQGACHHVVWFGIPWNLLHHDQLIARVYRQGQKSRTVYVYYIAAENTMDYRVSAVLRAKDRTQQTLNNQLERKQHA